MFNKTIGLAVLRLTAFLITGNKDDSGPEGLHNGWPIQSNQFPYMAAIIINDLKLACNGVLITNQIVLTAAHCVAPYANRPEYSTRVITGTPIYTAEKYNTTKLPFTESKIEKYYFHANWRPNDQERKNDIAILKLAASISINSRQKPIGLRLSQFSQSLPDENAIVSGWGTFGENFKDSVDLSYVELRIHGIIKECDKIGPFKIEEYHICFERQTFEGKEICIGGNGSPLVHDGTLVALATGIPCNFKGPDVYTKINHFRNFIEEVLKLENMLHPEAKLVEESISFKIRLAVPRLTAFKITGDEDDKGPEGLHNNLMAKSIKFPYMAAITIYDSKLVCNGVLITNQLVLTAAHCIAPYVNRPKYETSVITGTPIYNAEQYNNTKLPFTKSKISKYYFHVKWRPDSRERKYDITVLKLLNPIKVNLNQRPIRLPLSLLDFGLYGLSSGWGTFDNDFKISYSLQFLVLSFSDNLIGDCSKVAPFKIEDYQFCMKRIIINGKEACAGGSGSPLVYNGVLLALATGVPCNKYGIDIFTKVNYFINFIHEVLDLKSMIQQKKNIILEESISFKFGSAVPILTAINVTINDKDRGPPGMSNGWPIHSRENLYPFMAAITNKSLELNYASGKYFPSHFPKTISKIEKYYFHANWKPNDRERKYDIAILKLTAPISINSRQKPIGLPQTLQRSLEEKSARVVGWGYSGWRNFNDAYNIVFSDSLHYLNLSMSDVINDCNKVAPFIIEDYHICFKRRIHGVYIQEEMCAGGNGSPLIYNEILIAFATGVPCNFNGPDIFTLVYYFNDFINEVIDLETDQKN
ncbi:uncharacterized protein [Prorops nasuta]|uniref:uncharacterized protein isoform X2 n=1 Tax=Prorops nasuta TaxID=863751 RepID=UPI0034CEF104